MTEPSWSGRSVPDEAIDEATGPGEERSRRPSIAVVGLGLLLLANLAGLAYVVAQRSDDTETAATATEASGDGEGTEVVTTSSDTTTTTSDVTTTTEAPTTSTTEEPATTSTSEEPTTSTTEEPVATDPPAEDPRTAVLSGGVLYLRGAVPSQEVADTIAERAGAVVGPENVVVEYEIDPNAPLATSAPLYVEDVVLFAYGSTSINPAFEPLLDLGTLLMSQNPQVTVTVLAHTDSDGSAEFNQRLSELRGAAVARYWTDRGVNPDQIEVVAKGESEPVADESTAEGAAANRRAEFIINNLLG